MNRVEIRKQIRLSKKDEKYFLNLINRHSLVTNRIGTYKLFKVINNDKLLKNKFREFYLPKYLRDFNNKKMVYNEKLSESDAIEWAVYLIELFKDDINKYLHYKQIYEKYLFSGKYSDAYSTLLFIEKEICVSLWSCGQKLLLEEQISGLEANKKLLEKIFQETKHNLIVNTLLEFYSYIAEINMSYLNYQDKVKKFIESLGDQEVVRNYLNFKLDLDHSHHNDFKSIIQIDSQLSIIDLYNSYLEVVQVKSFECEFRDLDAMLSSSIKGIDDYRIRNILVKYSKWESELFPLTAGIEHNRVFEIIELYSKGDYVTSIQKLNTYLENNRNDFQMILLLIKSHINASEGMSVKFPIYQDIYNIYTINNSTNESFTNMYGYLKLYSGTSWKYKIRGFIGRKLAFTRKNINSYLSHINDLFLTPNFIENISKSEIRRKILLEFQKFCPLTTSLYLFKYDYSSEFHPKVLDPLRKKLFIATKEIEGGNINDAINLLISIREEVNNDDHYTLERVFRKLFLAYMKSNLLLECIELVVNTYFINENMIKRFELNEIIEKVKKNDDDLIKKNIKYPIFIYLYNKNDYKSQRIAYSNYMDYNSLNSVGEIIEINKNNIPLLVYFLHKICVQHLIKRDIRLATNGSLADEVRTEILRHLIILDPENRKLYYDEINSIMTKRGIRDRIKQINQSRIFVDVENIKGVNKEILVENFNKYIMVKRFEDEVTSIDITSEEYLDVLKNIVSEMNNRLKSDVNYSQEIIIFKGIISRITEEFLYNEKYGLNTFLSSRIRHGYVNRQLTTIFDEHNLMSKTTNDGSDIYSINEHWDKLVTGESNNFFMLKQYLSDFTGIIDKKVTEIKNEWIKIRYFTKDTGLLDYSTFVNRCLVINIDNIVDFDVFFETIITLLWTRTDELLGSLRKKIENELKSYFVESLNSLEINIKELEKTDISNLVIEVNRNINLCKVKLESVIKEFSDVFYKRDILYLDYSMEDLVATCTEINYKLNNTFNNVKLHKEIEIPYDFNGKSFSYFVDILNIIINNALEHSGVEDFSKLNIDVIIKEESSDIVDVIKDAYKEKCEKFMLITVKNNLGDGKDIEKIYKKVEEVFNNAKSHEILKKYTQTEGGSGLYKMYKTLQYNIAAPYSILYNVTSECFEITLIICIDNLILQGRCVNEDIICRG